MPRDPSLDLPDNLEDLSTEELRIYVGSSDRPLHTLNSVKIEPLLRSNTPEMEAVVSHLVELMRDKGCTIGNQINISLHLNIILSNLFFNHRQNPGHSTAYSRDSSRYVARYLGPGVGYRGMKNAADGLIKLKPEHELVEDHDGINPATAASGYTSRLEAKPFLIDLLQDFGVCLDAIKLIDFEPEVIILKRERRYRKERPPPINYSDTSWTREMRALVQRYNAFLNNTEINLSPETPELDFDVEKISVKRVFNNGSFELGGRFYGGWWQTKKLLRPFILLNGSPTLELDFGSLVVHQAYSEVGLSYELSEDPYILPDIDLGRDFLKRAFCIMLNSKNRRAALYTITETAESDDYQLVVDAEQIASALEEKHPLIRELFHTKAALEFQYQDSCVAEMVIEKCMNAGIPILTIHDSYIMPVQDEQTVRDFLHDALVAIGMTSLPPIEIKHE